MPLHRSFSAKRYLIPLVVILYIVTFICLLSWMDRLKPSADAEIKQVQLNRAARTLSISGNHFPSNLTAVLTPNMQQQKSTLSSRLTWGNVYNVASANNHLWVANGVYGVLSYNLDSPEHPKLAGTLSLEENFNAWNITAKNNVALISGGHSGLAIVDISNPSSPQLITTLYQNKIVFDSTIKNDTAFIVTSKNGLIVLDISNIKKPVELGKLPLNARRSRIIQHGTKAFVLSSVETQGVLHIFDISQPHQPIKITTIKLDHQVINCQQVDNKLLVSAGKDGLYIYDIATLESSPKPQGWVDVTVYELCASGSDVFISNGSHHVHHYQINNGTLSHIKSFATEGKCHNVDLFNTLLVVSLGKNGFTIFDPTKESSLSPATLYFNKTYGKSADIIRTADCFIVHSIHQLSLFRKTENQPISQYASITFKNTITAITWDKKYAYVALNNKEILLVDLRHKATQRVKKLLTLPIKTRDLAIDGSTLFIGDKKKGIFSFNLEQPTLPTEGPPIISQPYSRFAIAPPYLYLATKPNGFKVYRLREDREPALIGELQYPSLAEDHSHANGIALKDGYAFVINGEMGLLSIDISNPYHPRIGDALSLTGGSMNLVIQGGFAYISTNKTKVTVVDISNPLKMKILCELPITNAVAFSGDDMYQLNDRGVHVNALPKPLIVDTQSTTEIKFKLPIETTEGYYDLQLATTQQITKHSDLLYFSKQYGWRMTREIDTNK